MAKDGAFGVIFRTTNSAEGGGEKTGFLGINFLSDYGFTLRLQFVLSKHRLIPMSWFRSHPICFESGHIREDYGELVLILEVFVNIHPIPSFPIMMRTRCYLADGGIRFSCGLIDRAAIDITCLD